MSTKDFPDPYWLEKKMEQPLLDYLIWVERAELNFDREEAFYRLLEGAFRSGFIAAISLTMNTAKEETRDAELLNYVTRKTHEWNDRSAEREEALSSVDSVNTSPKPVDE